MYKCVKCGEIIKELPRSIRCPACAFKIFSKIRTPIARKVKAE